MNSSLSLPVSRMLINNFSRSYALNSSDLNLINDLSIENCVGPCNLIIALIYINRFKQSINCDFDDYNPAELYLSALVLATKYLNDGDDKEFLFNVEWAQLSGFSISTINNLELRLLETLDWNLFIPSDVFEEALKAFEYCISIELFNQNGQLTYSMLNNVLSRDFECFKCVLRFISHLVLILVAYLSSVIVLFSCISLISNLTREFYNSNNSQVFRQVNITTALGHSDLLKSYYFNYCNRSFC